MEELALQQPELIGREEELNKLKQSLGNAIVGKGSTIFISGEAGIGKTRLVSELIKEAESKKFRIIKGWCLTESLEPLMPIKSALREAGLFHLISGDPPPLVVSTYLMNEGGVLIAKAEREQMALDSDIFASMLTAIGSFVKDSLQMVDQVERTGGLNSLGYKDFIILIEEHKGLHLASVTKGSLSEFLVTDMKEILTDVQRNYGSDLKDWDGGLDKVAGVEKMVSRLVTCGKYDGKFLVDDPRIRQENLFDNVLFGIQRSSMEKPILLFLDDLQWADPSTLNMLHYLARNTRKNKVLLLGTYRPEDIVELCDGKSHQLETAMQNMNREDLLDKLELKRLDSVDTEKLIESTLGNISLEKSFFENIYKETEGTPLFILEVVKLLNEDGSIAQNDEDTWTLVTNPDKLNIPSKVYDVVKRRLNRLIKEQKEILECASVIGEEFSSEVVGSVVDLNKIQLLKNLSEIEKTHQLIHYLQDNYRFDHAKVKEVLYNSIGEELRKEYHKIVGDTIAELHKDNLGEALSEIAHHYYEARDEKAGEYLVKAGDMAKETYANEEAIWLYKNAMEMIKEAEKRRIILENLGDIHNLTGEFETAIDSYSKALESESDIKILANIHHKIADVYENTGEFNKGKAECEKGLALLGGDITFETSKVLTSLGRTYMRLGEYENAIDTLKQSLAIADKLNIDSERGKIYHLMGSTFLYQGDYDQALDDLLNAYKIRDSVGDLEGASASLCNIGNVYARKGEYQKALEYYEPSVELVRKTGNRMGVANTLGNIGSIHVGTGDLDKAIECLDESIKISREVGDTRGLAISLINLNISYHMRGDTETALKIMKEAEALCDKYDFKYVAIYAYNGISDLLLKLERAEEALGYAKKALSVSKEIGTKDGEGMSYICMGSVYRMKGDLDKALEIYEKSRVILEELEHNQLGELYYCMAKAWNDKYELSKATEFAEKALIEYKKIGEDRNIGDCYKLLEEIEKSKKVLD